jgi:uncharacterized protein
MHSQIPTGSALFDPIALKVAYLSEEETGQLLRREAGIISAVEDLGFVLSEGSSLLLFNRSGIVEISESSGGERDYVSRIRTRLENDGATGEVSRLSGFRIVVTDKCNMACRYCFVDTNTGARDITLEELKTGFELLFSFNKGRAGLNYQWFGGEPLIRKDLLIEGDNLAKKLSTTYGVSLRPTIVTNGTILDDKILKHFEDFGYGVGVSIDGPPDVNSSERRFISGRPTEHLVEANIKKLLQAGIHVGANVTPTASNFLNLDKTGDYILEMGIRFIYVNSPIPIRRYWIEDGKKWAEVLFRARLRALGKGAMLFSHLDRIYQAIDTRIPRVFEHLQSCGGLNAALLPGGKISVLDLNWRNPEYVFSVDEISRNPELMNKARKNLFPVVQCVACEAAGICGGPSVNDRLLLEQDEPLEQYCQFFKRAVSLVVFDKTGLQ